MRKLKLEKPDGTLVTVREDGDDWACWISKPDGSSAIRYYSRLSAMPCDGLTVMSRKIRKEFGITGTYKPA